jgi:mRNA interferase YafQ
MLTADYTNTYKKTLKAAKKKHRDIDALETVIDIILAQKPLPGKYNDHALSGNYKDKRELHITHNPDFLLVYEVWEDMAIFYAVGSHDDLFR